MLRSMFSGVSGLRSHQTMMDVIGNNIANVNTVGYKSSATVFQDTLSQVVRAGGAPAADRGGTNPAQVGLGVKLAAITTNWTNGAAQSTGRSTDFMIEGDGFFVTRGPGGEQLYTRAGAFNFDATGKLVTTDGGVLQGWAADDAGDVDTTGPIGAITGAFVGGHVGQLVGAMSATKDDGNDADENRIPVRQAGMLVAVEAAGAQDRAADTLRAVGAADLEIGAGNIVAGDWQDFDPVAPPRFIDQQTRTPDRPHAEGPGPAPGTGPDVNR